MNNLFEKLLISPTTSTGYFFVVVVVVFCALLPYHIHLITSCFLFPGLPHPLLSVDYILAEPGNNATINKHKRHAVLLLSMEGGFYSLFILPQASDLSLLLLACYETPKSM